MRWHAGARDKFIGYSIRYIRTLSFFLSIFASALLELLNLQAGLQEEKQAQSALAVNFYQISDATSEPKEPHTSQTVSRNISLAFLIKLYLSPQIRGSTASRRGIKKLSHIKFH